MTDNLTLPAVGTVIRSTQQADGSHSQNLMLGIFPSTDNTTTTPLSSAATYTGTGEIAPTDGVAVSCQTDNTGTLYFDFSVDGTNWSAFPSNGFAIASGIHEYHTAKVNGRYFRVRLVNDTGAQSYLRLYTYFGPHTAPNAPINQSLSDDSDATIVKTIPAEQLIAEGRWTDRFYVHKFGRNSDQDSGDLPADVWDGGGGGGAYTGFPTESEAVQCVSTSSSDTGTIHVSGLDENWEVQSETVTLTGTTPADTAGTYRRVNRVYNTSASNFVGTITVQHTTTTANIFSVIAPGAPIANQTQVAAYTIPAGHTGYLKYVRCSTFGTAANRCEGGVFIREPGSVFRMNIPFDTSGTSPFQESIEGGIPCPEKTDIVVRMFSASANNLEIIARFDLLVVKN